MADRSAIEWTEATWNPVTGCDEVSPGCAHCYAKTFAERWRGITGHPYEQGFALRLGPARLGPPLRGGVRPPPVARPPGAPAALAQAQAHLRQLDERPLPRGHPRRDGRAG